MKTQFTAGPWQAESRSISDGSLVVKDSEFNEICVVRNQAERHYGPDNERDMANSALIAASPDLLAALQDLLAKIDLQSSYGNMEGTGDWSNEMSQARAAIAKATQ